MRNLLNALFLISLAVSSCAKMYAIDKADFNAIPKGSKIVTVTSPLSPDSAFKHVSAYFARNGWVVNSNKDVYQISPDPKSIGAGTLLKPIVNIEPEGAGSRVNFRGEWGLDQDGQIMMQSFYRGANIVQLKPIVFQKNGTTKPDAAFQALVVYARRVPGEISYRK